MDITTSYELDIAIKQLTLKSEAQKIMLRERVNEIVDSLNPANLIKSTFNNIVHDNEFTSAAIGTSVGLGAGVLSKKIIQGKSPGVFKRILGTIVELAVAKGISSNSDVLIKKGLGVLKKITK